jgi:uncharacterized protein YacL (UPF0231 family)
VVREEIVGKINADTLVIDWYKYHNDSLVDSDETKIKFNASIKREKDEVMTTTNRLNNLDFTFAEAKNTQNGKMQYVSSQTGSDDDGQNYTVDMTSEKIANFHGLENVHFILNSAKSKGFSNENRTPKANESVRVKSTMKWNASVSVVGVPNLAGQSFEYALNTTNHERFIPKNAPELLRRGSWKVWKETGNWSTIWHFECNEYWSNDSVAPKSKLATLKGTYSRKDLDDKIVSNLVDYTHPTGDLVWGNWYDVESKDTGVTLREKKGTKKSLATNGFDADKFNTEFSVTMQEADVMFCDSLFHVSSDEATLTNQRNVFLDEDSDRDGYQMVRFTDTELAQWAGQYDQKLDETCKLYLKLTPIELDKIEFVGTKVHSNGMAKIDGSVTPVYSDGSKGAAISFKWEKAESWKWMKDSVIFNDVNFVMEETGTLTLKGEEKKTAKTFATDNENITIKCNEYTADFQTTVKVDGGIKYTTWRAVWYEDFKVVYSGKEVSLTKSSYNVKNQNDKLTKDEARSTATTEVWNYSVNGIFTIDEDSRSAYGYGRLTKAIAEEIVTEGWDRFNFETDAKEYTDRVEYFLKWIREYSTGKKTSQEVKIILKRNAEGSAYTVTVEDPERKIGDQSETSSYVSRTESASDIVINYDWKTSKFELPNVFDGKTTKNDVATFVDPTNVKVSKKNSKGEDVEIALPSFEHQLTSTVSELQKVSENDDKTEYTYTRVWNWVSSQCTSAVKSIGNIHVEKSEPIVPDFDIEVGRIIATVSRPSNRNASDITAYTYLLVSKDGKKCLPFGIYHDVITEGVITDWSDNVYGKGKSFNGACYVKDANQVVATYSVAEGGFVKWYGVNSIVDAAKEITLQGAGFNDRGNDCINHTGKYAPTVVKKANGVVEVQFSGTSKTYTFKGWDVK